MINTFAQDPPERVSADSVLWRPTSVGALQLPHRLAMAPMTRDRSAPDGSPTFPDRPQRRVLPATRFNRNGHHRRDPAVRRRAGLPLDPRHLHRRARRRLDAGSRRGASRGRTTDRATHARRSDFTPRQHPASPQPVAPAPIAPKTQMFTAGGMQPIPRPTR